MPAFAADSNDKSTLGDTSTELKPDKSSLGEAPAKIDKDKSRLGETPKKVEKDKSELGSTSASLAKDASALGTNTVDIQPDKSNLGEPSARPRRDKSNLGETPTKIEADQSTLGKPASEDECKDKSSLGGIPDKKECKDTSNLGQAPDAVKLSKDKSALGEIPKNSLAQEKDQSTLGNTNAKVEKDQSELGNTAVKTTIDKSNLGESDDKSSDEKKSKKKRTDFADVLPCLTWVDPDIEPKAVILCVHGLGLHNDSYDAFGKRMSKIGYLVYAVDVPGFGSFKQAEGRERVDFNYCLRGIGGTLRFIHKMNPKMPVYILGESMGGAIALRFTSEHPELIDGMISSVPSGDRFKQGKETLRVGLKLLTSPNKEFDIGSSVINRATTKDSVKEHWSGDPLNRMNLTPKELVRFQDFMNENHDTVKNITRTPVLFVQGCKDTLVRPEGTMELYNAVASDDRTLELIHDGEHLIFEEGQFNDQVISMLDKWLVAHINKTKQLGSK